MSNKFHKCKKSNYVEFNPNGFRTTNTFTVPVSGWYEINFIIYHSNIAINTNTLQPTGLGSFAVGILNSTSTRAEWGCFNTTGPPDNTTTYTCILNYATGDTFQFVYSVGNTIPLTNQYYLIRINIVRLT